MRVNSLIEFHKKIIIQRERNNDQHIHIYPTVQDTQTSNQDNQLYEHTTH